MSNIKINFDINDMPEIPTFVLSNNNGNKIGAIPTHNIVAVDSLNNSNEISFKVYKYLNGVKCNIWDYIVSLKLVWCKEYDEWYQIKVEIDESDDVIKYVTCIQLGQAELSQINLYNIEINTENDISRDNYEPTVLYDDNNPNASLLDRILEKAPHYYIKHVDSTIKSIQRTFSFDGKSIADALNEISEELNCLVIYNSNSKEDGKIDRSISLYDLQTSCNNCGYRGDYKDKCPKCESTDLTYGYGDDTTIFLSSDELAKDIKLTTDVDSIKNCFKLEAGDDLMTATIRNCNPNGTDYIWYFSEQTKNDMSTELKNKINSYNDLYDYYQNEYEIFLTDSYINKYNNLVYKYKDYYTDIYNIANPIVGYIELMKLYYNVISFGTFLKDEFMPTVSMSKTTDKEEAKKLTSSELSIIAVDNLKNISESTINNMVLYVSKSIVNPRYKLRIKTSELNGLNWVGSITVENYSDEEDVYDTQIISININDNTERYIKQLIDNTLNTKQTESNSDAINIKDLFGLELKDFKNELKKYCLKRLNDFLTSCQGVIDILIEQGASQKDNSFLENDDLYDELYLPYRNKLSAIQSETKIREYEVYTLLANYDENNNLVSNGIENEIINIRNNIQDNINFNNYLGEDLWIEFSSYRREDKYSNSNYISDGLTDAEIFNNAIEFIEIAKNEIYKSANPQHSISSSLKNLLSNSKFRPILSNFKCGNWLRILIDETVYKLRLVKYTIDYDNDDVIDVEFSDTLNTVFGLSDAQSLISKLSSMATSYDSVKHQATQGNKANKEVKDFITDGLNVTKTKIIDSADNQKISWDSNGLLCREYLPITDSYSDEQLKIINNGIYITDDNWKTAKAGVGSFIFWNPKTQKYEESYGVIADTLVSNLVLSKEVGIYNEKGSISLDENGITITTEDSENSNNVFTIQKKVIDDYGNMSYEKNFYVDDTGNLNIKGCINSSSGIIGGWYIGTSGLYRDAKDSDSNTYRAGMYATDNLDVTKQSAFYIRKIDSSNNKTYPFYVRYDGKLVASNADIQGKIVSEEGEIGGWTISSKSIYKDCTNDDATYRVILNSPTTPTETTRAITVRKKVGTTTTYPFEVDYNGVVKSTNFIANTSSGKTGISMSEGKLTLHNPSNGNFYGEVVVAVNSSTGLGGVELVGDYTNNAFVGFGLFEDSNRKVSNHIAVGYRASASTTGLTSKLRTYLANYQYAGIITLSEETLSAGGYSKLEYTINNYSGMITTFSIGFTNSVYVLSSRVVVGSESGSGMWTSQKLTAYYYNASTSSRTFTPFIYYIMTSKSPETVHS